jgi:uncharacterized damage-inducible protein DinB
MNTAYFQTTFDYSYWAHRKVWACALTLSDEEFRRSLGYSWGSIRGQLVHTMSAEWVWLSRLRGESPAKMFSESDYPHAEDIRQRWDALENEMRAYLATLTEAELARVIQYRSTKGEPFQQSVWQVLAHVVNHGTDHRAQTLAMLYQLGAPTIEQDMLFYFREKALKDV